ncbi:MAG TPA: cobalamin-binding protein [Clostridia bacterium]|nr:cobalamin-binding protein [Clostridia bacterium]
MHPILSEAASGFFRNQDSFLEDIKENLIAGRASVVKLLTEQALRRGVPPEVIVEESLLDAMKEVNRCFSARIMAIPDVLLSSRALHAGLYVLKPYLTAAGVGVNRGRVLIGTVAGDLHDIGKRLVAIMMESKGFEVIDMGIDVPPEEFVRGVNVHNPDIVAMSALLTTTMGSMKTTIDLLTESNLRRRVKVIIGGGPVTQEFAQDIGADAYGYDAVSGAQIAVSMMDQMPHVGPSDTS